MVKNTQNLDKDIVEKLMSQSSDLCSEVLSNISEDWDTILKGKDDDIKIKKLHASLIKEQMRRETAEKLAREIASHSQSIKEQTTQRITDLKDNLESQIAFLNGQIRQLKRESSEDLSYYREQLEKASNALAKKNI